MVFYNQLTLALTKLGNYPCVVSAELAHASTPVNPLTTNVLHHIETGRLICIANQLTGVYMIWSIGHKWVNMP